MLLGLLLSNESIDFIFIFFEKRLLLAPENCASTAEATEDRSSLWVKSSVSSSSSATSTSSIGSVVIFKVSPKSFEDEIVNPPISLLSVTGASNAINFSYSSMSIIDIPIFARVIESITFEITSSLEMSFSFPSSNAAAKDTFGLSFDFPAPPTSGFRERIADSAVW